MAHLLAPEGTDVSAYDICGKNPKSKRIHDKEKVVYIHDDSRVRDEVVNRGLKVARASTTAASGLTAGVGDSRMLYKRKIGKRTGGRCFLDFKNFRQTLRSL